MAESDARPQETRGQYHCSFCGKPQKEVRRLIAGPGAVYICDECVELCQEIVHEESAQPPPSPQPILKRGDAEALVSYAETLTALVSVAKLCVYKHNTLPQDTAIHLIRSMADVAVRLQKLCLELLPSEPPDTMPDQ